ncbi:WD40 repeat-like protein [Ramaria rubella]|nr:WD40 repeat-like protein [Ramaria rubella]
MPSSAGCLRLPSSVIAIAFEPSGKLAVASDDGTLRIYDPPYIKVWKAIRNLGSEISSVVFGASVESHVIWVACNQHVLCFSLDTTEATNLILGRKDALLDLRLTEEEDDVLNEITLNSSHLAYSLDSGSVGVLDLKTREKTAMKTPHTNLCTNVSFIPDRPRELVSGGYDSALLHFDFHLGSLLSSLEVAKTSEPTAQMSFSPPFVLSLAVSQTGLAACGLGDGRVWLGSGGEKALSSDGNSSARKKKRRKWEGLREDDGTYSKIAEGPIVAIAFASPHQLFTLTLLGNLALHEVKDGRIERTIWTTGSPELVKANVLAINSSYLAVGGFDVENKGVLLLWLLQDREALSVS